MMKKFFGKIGFLHIILAIFSLTVLIGLSSQTYAYQEILIENRGGHAIRVIKVVLDGEHFVVSSVADRGGETIQSLTKKVGGISSINGAFFCPKDYSNCDTTFSYYERIFQGDGASYSQFWPDTSIRGIFGFTQDGKPLFVQNKISDSDVGLVSNINSERIFDLYFGISNFPVLLIEGDDVTAGASNYIDGKLTGKGNRNFICSTEDGKTIYMGVIGTMSVWDMAPYLKKQFGCYNALFLDAGASTAMVYDKKVLDQGSRKLITDAFVVVDRDTFLELGGTPDENYTPYEPEYEMTYADWKKVRQMNKMIDSLIAKHGKTKYKTPVIKAFRKKVSGEDITPSMKAVYNQFLIHMFTIEEL